MPNHVALSRRLHSHSRRPRNSTGEAKTSLSSTASISKTRTADVTRSAISAAALSAACRPDSWPMVAVEPSPAAMAYDATRWRVDQVHEDQQVGAGGPGIQRDFAGNRAANLGKIIGIFGIVIGQQAIGVERPEDALTHDVLQVPPKSSGGSGRSR